MVGRAARRAVLRKNRRLPCAERSSEQVRATDLSRLFVVAASLRRRVFALGGLVEPIIFR